MNLSRENINYSYILAREIILPYPVQNVESGTDSRISTWNATRKGVKEKLRNSEADK
jgi:hypothetical protein